jgi:hypothetical protein
MIQRSPRALRVARWPSSLLVLTLSLSLPAAAASQRAALGVSVHGHQFHRVAVEAVDCELRYKLYFRAPAERYPSARGYYKFKARIKFHGGQSMTSLVFGNAGPGERVYDRTFDTTAEGCWAKQDLKLLGVDVEACRGRGCTPEPFR